MYKVVYTKTFEKDFKKLDKSVAQRITEKILKISKAPYNIQSLKYSPKGLEKLCKLRIGDWRLLFWIEHKEKIITLYIIEHRSEIYGSL